MPWSEYATLGVVVAVVIAAACLAAALLDVWD